MEAVHAWLSLALARDFPCKLFHTTGNCINGDDCMFSHEPLTDETRELLDKVRCCPGPLQEALLATHTLERLLWPWGHSGQGAVSLPVLHTAWLC